MGHRIVHGFGDSHVSVFDIVARFHLARTWCDVNDAGGATALGLANEASRSGAARMFRSRIARLPRHRTLLFMIGEIDCGYLLWLRAEGGMEPIEVGLQRSLDNYTGFLAEVRSGGRRRLIVSLVQLPAVVDYAAGQGVPHNRAPIAATLAERTDLTREFNERLRRWALRNGCGLLDFETDTTDPSTGLVRPELRNPDPSNHHYHGRVFAPVIAARLRGLGYR